MRYVSLTLLIALSFIAGSANAAGAKAPPPDVGAGRIAWFDIASPDVPRAKEFYAKLLDWTYMPVTGAGSDQVVEIRSRGQSIGTLRGADGKLSVFNGVVYVQVSDLPKSCAKVQELGGTVVEGFPFDLPDGTGAIAVILDPTGHPLGLYSRAQLPKRIDPRPGSSETR